MTDKKMLSKILSLFEPVQKKGKINLYILENKISSENRSIYIQAKDLGKGNFKILKIEE